MIGTDWTWTIVFTGLFALAGWIAYWAIADSRASNAENARVRAECIAKSGSVIEAWGGRFHCIRQDPRP